MNIYNLFLRIKKNNLLNEAKQDMVFLESYHGKDLFADENNLRDQLAKESQKEKPDEKKIEELTEQVSRSKSTKTQYQRLLLLVKELEVYKSLIGKEPEDPDF